MIDLLVTALSKELDLSAEEIADTIWLAMQIEGSQSELTSIESLNIDLPQIPIENAGLEPERFPNLDTQASDVEELDTRQERDEPKAGIYPRSQQDNIFNSGLSFKVPDAPSLREPLTLARALRPLMRRISSGTTLVLDEAATTQQIADRGLWLPVLKPTLEPWLDLDLVIDEAISMQIWRQTITELERLLKNYGIFRDVRVWGLITGDREQVQIRRGIGATAKNQSPRSPKELIDPSGRRLVLVVSDCVSSLWRDGKMTSTLELWAKQGSMAIVQMLPKWLWKRTALGRASEVRLQSLTSGMFNQKLIVKEVSLWEELDEKRGVKVPVFTLESERMATWAQMVAGKGSIWTSGYMFKLNATPVNRGKELFNLDRGQLNAEERVQAFRVTASPMARKLAGLLAAAPVISLPIVRLIQETLLRDSQQVHVAEVFLGGLLKPLSEINAETNPNYMQYEFIDGVRALLVDSVPSGYVLNVVDEVSKYVARKVGLSLEDFAAVLRNPQEIKDSKIVEDVGYFATITAQVLRRLGGQYVKITENLELRINVIDSSTANIICPLCAHNNPEGSEFCDVCGHELSEQISIDDSNINVIDSSTANIICPLCAHNNPEGSEFCDVCGHELSEQISIDDSNINVIDSSTANNFCPMCAHNNPEGSEFCEVCGHELNYSQHPLNLNHSQHPLNLPIGSLLNQDRYQIEEAIGQGGFSLGYKATDLFRQRKVFIKELFDNGAGRRSSEVVWRRSTTSQEVNESIKTFLNEAKFISRCVHPNIVRIYDWFEENATAYIIMDFIQGKSLHKILKEEKRLSINKLKHYFKQVADALKIIHSENILHRDIKPDNIIIDENDKAILIDFGNAREYLDGRTGRMTQVLTPGYAPPEQYITNAKRVVASDIYSLCASMYELVTGEMPIDAIDRIMSIANHTLDSLIPPHDLLPDIDPNLDQIILKGMQINVDNRFQNMNEFINALDSLPHVDLDESSQESGDIILPQLQINYVSRKTVKITSDINSSPPFYSLSSQFRLIGDRNAGKTTYLAALARIQKINSSIIQNVIPIGEDGHSLIDLANNVMLQGIQIEPTYFRGIASMNYYSLRIFLKKQFSWKSLSSLFRQNTTVLDISCKDYAGEFFGNFIDGSQSNPSLFEDYIEDILQSQGFLLLIDSQSQEDNKQAKTIYELLRSIKLKTENNSRRRIAVVLTKSDLLQLQLNKHNPRKIVSSHFPESYKQLQLWQNQGNEVEYFFSSAFGFLDKRFSKSNSTLIQRDSYGASSVIKDPSRWKPFGLVSPIYWLCTGERYKEFDFE